ncbi:AAA family ATPase [Allopusillimonas ginsengisoli]|uniref:AAA family ATPase n=1 Tax=Allopusillimonas ginsengisoli TaxID=453575 RepID=UPI0010208203|nr:AAA family ATPase [Allopusillimonas ginsengisoli]TEA79505.1 hypothetical protein ERE07_00660 [Allopusillimonas ginsengisoli]
MRILQVRFKNLNSLVGEWEIDFTHPDYVSGGIFAITGPTGAGKSTILDAICLALHGRTPRLSKVTQSDNEIMSRQTSECFAEVTFETTLGRYRCHWSQHRARKRADGALQQPRHEIADADSGQIVENKIRAVAGVIEKTTGMDFDRFTRSMLLAQGGFAAFLQASPDERAPILEQITGTEIYSLISMRVHERRAEAQRKQEVLLAELAGMQLLDAGQEAALQASLQEKSGHHATLQTEIEKQTGAVDWLNNIEKIEQTLASIDQQQQAVKMRMASFAPARDKLARALSALELEADHSRLALLRQEQEADRRSLEEGGRRMPALKQACDETATRLMAAAQAVDLRRAEYDSAQPLLRQVRELDLLIREKTQPLATADKVIAVESESLSALMRKQGDDTTALSGKKRSLDAERAWQEANQVDEALVTQLAGIEGQLSALQAIQQQCKAKQDQLKVASAHASACEQTYRRQQQRYQQCESDFARHQRLLQEAQQAQHTVLQGVDLVTLRKRLAEFQQRTDILDKAGAALRHLDEISTGLVQCDAQIRLLNEAIQQASGEAEAAHANQQQLENEERLLQTQLDLLLRIASLEDARQHLHDGEPCPLCGAREHPYADRIAPLPDETRQQLAQTREALRAARAALTAATIRLTELRKDMQQARAKHQADTARITHETAELKRWQDAWRALEHDKDASADGITMDGLAQLLEDAKNAAAAVQKQVHEAERLEQGMAGLRTAAEQARETLAKAGSERQEARFQQESAAQQRDRLQQDAASIDAQREDMLEALRTVLGPFGWARLAQDELADVQGKLADRRSTWLARQQLRLLLERDIALLDARIQQQAHQIQRLEQEQATRRTQRAELAQQRDALVQSRQTLFGEQRPESEEGRLAEALRLAVQRHEQARTAHEAGERTMHAFQAKLQELESTLAARSSRIALETPAFLLRLTSSGFQDEAQFNAARLPEAERRSLEQQAGRLDSEHAALATRAQDSQTLLVQVRQLQLTDRPRDELLGKAEQLRAAQQALTLEIAGLHNRLEDNRRLRQTQQERIGTLEAQQRECARWNQLHELIGSADGKKFRNFAQGLTFEMMVAHANRQLQEMTDRYLLVRDETHPLDLNVMDNYQAGEVRSTINLSGGESFIVSLALALGLSHMASRNVRVDSLFLDEGFGTLDEDALDTALTTLSSLQQAGKLIGVISHVAALKERIGTQIQVSPQNGGRSAISGPGCRRVAA